MLTDKQIPKLKPGLHADTGGLYLRVRESGRKTWVRRTQSSTGERKVTIGQYPAMSLSEARRALTSSEMDSDAAIIVYKTKLQVKRMDHIDHIMSPLCVKKPLVSHTRSSLMQTLQAKADYAPVMANRMLTRWQDFFNFCVQQGWLEHNPLFGVQRKFVGGKEKPRNRVLSEGDIARFLNLVLDPHTKLALYVILATGLRPSEALWFMRNKAFDAIPTKTVPYNMPRVPHIRAILSKVERVPASHLTLSNALRRAGADFRPHDLRRTFATRLSDLGVMPHVVEKLLNHKMTGVMAVYNHAEYWQERVEAMKVWGHKLSRLRATATASRA